MIARYRVTYNARDGRTYCWLIPALSPGEAREIVLNVPCCLEILSIVPVST